MPISRHRTRPHIPLPLPTDRTTACPPCGLGVSRCDESRQRGCTRRSDKRAGQGLYDDQTFNPVREPFRRDGARHLFVTEMLGQPSTSPAICRIWRCPRPARPLPSRSLGTRRRSSSIYCRPDDPGRRLCYGQQRSGDAQHLQRRSEAYGPLHVTTAVTGCRAEHQQQKRYGPASN